MRKWSLLFAVLTASSACSRDVSGTPADLPSTNLIGAKGGVTIAATVVSHTTSGDSVTIHIANTGTQTAFLPPCGPGPLLRLQQFLNGNWIGGVQNFMCLSSPTPGPIRLAPGASIDVSREFGAAGDQLSPGVPGTYVQVNTSTAGRYRFIITVFAHEDLSDPSTAESNGFDIP
jgi:hypothetical protein